MFIDTHTHIYLEKFDEDREACMVNAKEAGVHQLYLPNIDINSIPQVRKCVLDYPDMCIPMMGLHPCSVFADYEHVLSIIQSELDSYPYAAVGEVGLDFYWSRDFVKEQEIVFRTQIEWGIDKELPVIIHSRDSLDECISMISQHTNEKLTGIFHCFTGTIEQAMQIIDLGFLIGIGGVVTFKNAGLDKVVAEIPIEHLVLETDAPFLTPHPHRGKRNESKYIPLIAEKICEAKHIGLDELARKTSENARLLFEKKATI